MSAVAAPVDRPEPSAPARKQPSAFRTRLRRWDVKVSPYLLIAPFFIVFAVFGAYPLLYTAWVSLHDWQVLGGNLGFVGLDHYEYLLTEDPYFWNAVRNTFGIFLVATVPQLLLALVLASVLNRNLRGLMLFRMGIYLPAITSVAAVAIIFSMIFARDFGIVNWVITELGFEKIDWRAERWSSWTAISIMIDWRWTGYNALIFLAAMQSIPKDLYEAADIDGAGPARQFFSVTLPMLRPTIIFITIISTIGGIQLFTEPLLFNPGAGALSGGDLRQFQTVMMLLFENFQIYLDMGYAAAIAWMLVLMTMVVAGLNFLITRRIASAD